MAMHQYRSRNITMIGNRLSCFSRLSLSTLSMPWLLAFTDRSVLHINRLLLNASNLTLKHPWRTRAREQDWESMDVACFLYIYTSVHMAASTYESVLIPANSLLSSLHTTRIEFNEAHGVDGAKRVANTSIRWIAYPRDELVWSLSLAFGVAVCSFLSFFSTRGCGPLVLSNLHIFIFYTIDRIESFFIKIKLWYLTVYL